MISAQVCRRGSDAAPVLVGTVRDADHGIPLLGARVLVRWEGAADEAGRGVRTDADGRFALCDLPAGARVVLFARAGSRTGRERAVEIAAEGDAPSVELIIPLDDARGASGLVGTVRSRDGRGVAGADVRLDGQPATRITNADGGFVFERVPPGSYVLHVEHLAYAPFLDTVHLAPGRPLQLEIPVATEPIPVEGIEITVQSPIWMQRRADLFQRMKMGSGHFITRGQIADRGEPPLSALLRGVPGVAIHYVMVAGRYVHYPVIRGSGVPALYVDGARVSLDPERGHGIDDFLASDVDVIEIQSGPASIPIGMSGSCAACGLIHIWTRAP
jgi:hypothetical protein